MEGVTLTSSELLQGQLGWLPRPLLPGQLSQDTVHLGSNWRVAGTGLQRPSLDPVSSVDCVWPFA